MSSLRRRAARRGQSGVSLIEVLVATAVMAPLVLGASTGLFTAVTASTNSRDRQQLEAALGSYGDAVKAMPYVACGTPTSYRSAYAAWPQRWVPDPGSGLTSADLSFVTVEYWNQSSASFTGTCGSDGGAQRITVTVAKGGESLTGAVVKRDPDAMPAVSP